MIQRLDRNLPSSPCNLVLLERLSNDTLDDQQSATLASHLDECPRCRQRLDAMEQNDATWPETREVILKESKPNRFEAPEHAPSVPATTDSLVRWLEPAPGLSEPHDRWIGSLDGYSIRRILGLGGMGVVFDAWDPKLHRTVAIKAMHPHLAANGTAKQRFVREARAAAAVVHPNVVAIHSVSADHDPPYLVMPLVAGESLQTRIDLHGPLEIDAALRIAAQIADGLAAAHAQGLIHRDIKPGNILVEQGTERALLTDFGVVRALNDATMTASGVIAGTPEFMSPEQANGDTLDARSDLFSLGSVLYTMLAGNPPFRADSALAVLRRIEKDNPRPLQEHRPEVPDSVQILVDWLLAKSPEHRIDSASSVAELLKSLLANRLDPKHHKVPRLLSQRILRTARQSTTWMWAPLLVFTLFIGVVCYWTTATNLLHWGASPVTSGQRKASGGRDSVLGSDPVDAELDTLNRYLKAIEEQLEPLNQVP